MFRSPPQDPSEATLGRLSERGDETRSLAEEAAPAARHRGLIRRVLVVARGLLEDLRRG